MMRNFEFTSDTFIEKKRKRRMRNMRKITHFFKYNIPYL